MKKLLDDNTPYIFFESLLLRNFRIIDESNRIIPLELGQFLEGLTYDDEYIIGIHKSNSIISNNVFEDPILYQIMTQGLINNEAAMQGIITHGVLEPGRTVFNANDPIAMTRNLLSTYRDSNGSVILKLPKKYVNGQLDILNKENASQIYDYDENGISYIKPEFIIGYVQNVGNTFKYYSKEEIIENHKRKKL
jgi:hypothetical protein